MTETKKDPEAEAKDLERSLYMAGQVELLFMLAGGMIPYLDLLTTVQEHAERNLSFVTNGAVIVEALGKDSEMSEIEARLRLKRVDALINLIQILKDTQEGKDIYVKDKVRKDILKDKIAKDLGL